MNIQVVAYPDNQVCLGCENCRRLSGGSDIVCIVGKYPERDSCSAKIGGVDEEEDTSDS